MDLLRGDSNEQLDALFQAYGKACSAPDPSANFMPHLWQKIEARQNSTFVFRRMANALVTAAMAASIALGVYMAAVPHRTAPNPYSYSTYVEALANANSIETPDIVAPVRLDLSDSQ